MGTVNQEERISALDEQVSLRDLLMYYQKELISNLEEQVSLRDELIHRQKELIDEVMRARKKEIKKVFLLYMLLGVTVFVLAFSVMSHISDTHNRFNFKEDAPAYVDPSIYMAEPDGKKL